MSKGVWVDVASLVALEGVVADLAGGVEGFFYVACFEEVAPSGAVGPYACKAVCLQFLGDGELVGVCLAHATLGGADLVGDAEQVLYVVADFVGDDVGLGKVAGGTELVLETAVEVKIYIDLLVGGAVEGADGSLGGATG